MNVVVPSPIELSELFINGFKLVEGETLSKLKADIKSTRNKRFPCPTFFEAELLEYLDKPNVFIFIRDEPGKDVVLINKNAISTFLGGWWRLWRKDRSLHFRVCQDNPDLLKLLSKLKEEDER